MLKITVPFREKKEVIPLIEAGADELYCGYIAPEWIRKYSPFEFERKGSGACFGDLGELKEAVDLAREKAIPVYLALNGLYVKHQYPLLIKIVSQLDRINFSGYILADIGLLLTLVKQGCRKQLHISTGGTVFNSEAARFYKELGASRIILDRQTSLESMRRLSADNPDIDFEVFILNFLCVYIDGFCTFLHAYGREMTENISGKNWKQDEKLRFITGYDLESTDDPCGLHYSVGVYDSKLNKRIEADSVRPAFYKQLRDCWECGACAIYEINKTRVKSIKIVGRHFSCEKRLKDTKFIRSALDILRNNKDIARDDFIGRVQTLYRQAYSYDRPCRGNNCYYPQVLPKADK